MKIDKKMKKLDTETIADAVLRDLNKIEKTATFKIVDLDEVPEFLKYKKSLPMDEVGWIRKWDKSFSSQLMKELSDRDICVETGKVMGKKEARGFATEKDNKIDKIYVIVKKC